MVSTIEKSREIKKKYDDDDDDDDNDNDDEFFVVWLTDEKVFSLTSSRNSYQRSSPSRVSDTGRENIAPKI